MLFKTEAETLLKSRWVNQIERLENDGIIKINQLNLSEKQIENMEFIFSMDIDIEEKLIEAIEADKNNVKVAQDIFDIIVNIRKHKAAITNGE